MCENMIGARSNRQKLADADMSQTKSLDGTNQQQKERPHATSVGLV